MIDPTSEPTSNADDAKAPSTTPPSAVSREALVFRSRRAATKRPASRRHKTSNWGWWLVALVLAVVFLLLIRALLERTAWSAGDRSTVQAPAATPPDARFEASTKAEAQPADAGPELIDWYTGTTIHDLPAGASRPRQPSAVEVRESQRKADEAVKLLEADTPES